jgi:hypothetical protein
MNKYRHTHDMGRIASAEDGEQIEECCQAMLGAAAAHLDTLRLNKNRMLASMFINNDQHMDKMLGILRWVSKKHKLEHEFPKMHRMLLPRLFYIANNGWDAYCNVLRQPGVHNGR